MEQRELRPMVPQAISGEDIAWLTPGNRGGMMGWAGEAVLGEVPVKSLVMGLVLMVGSAVVSGQTAQVTAKILFKAPTTRVPDGSPITGPLYYSVFAGDKGQTQKSRLVTTSVPGATSITIPNVTLGTCFELAAVEDQGAAGKIEGPHTVESCLGQIGAPGVPTNVVLQLVITTAP